MNLMMLGLFGFIALGLLRAPDLRTHLLVLVIAICLVSAYWLTGRV
ncbi:MAG: hypothetical protein WEE64_10490 [Dehalococcoidia bacterium]